MGVPVRIGATQYSVDDGEIIHDVDHNTQVRGIGVFFTEGLQVCCLYPRSVNGSLKVPIGMSYGNSAMPSITASGTTTQWGPKHEHPVFVTSNFDSYYIDFDFKPFFVSNGFTLPGGASEGVSGSHRIDAILRTPVGDVSLFKLVSGNIVAAGSEIYIPSGTTKMQIEVDISSVLPVAGTMEVGTIIVTQSIFFQSVPGYTYPALGGYVLSWPALQPITDIQDYRGIKYLRIHQRKMI